MYKIRVSVFEEAEGDYMTHSLPFPVLIEKITLRKHAYSNILKLSPPKNESFGIKILIFFIFSLKNIDCVYSLEPPRRGSSNEYNNLNVWAEISKIMYTPVNPSFTIQSGV